MLRIYSQNNRSLLTFLLLIILASFTSLPQAQQTNKAIQVSETPIINITAPDIKAAIAADSRIYEPGMPYRIGIGSTASINLMTDGRNVIRPDGSTYSSVGISMAGAEAIILYFDAFRLAEGSRLRITNTRMQTLAGPYSSSDNPQTSSYFSSGLLGQDTIIIHLETPSGSTEQRMHIYEVGYVYEKQTSLIEKGIQVSGACQVNVICSPEGNNWQDKKHSVARILLKVGTNYYLCSGSLINNTSQNCTPYFLTAQHCGNGASANDLNQWVFYFNYDGLNCSSTSPQTTQSVVGATKRASAINSVGNYSDMLLLELNQTVPENFQPYFSGWNRNNSPASSGVGIHHPAGDIKKISTYTSTLTNYFNTHWDVRWIATANGHGTTEGGSSGSPLFNSNGEIVGTLTGGYSSCTNLTSADYYGKFSYHWSSNGTLASQQLAPWLDPISANVTTLAGKYCLILNADFYAAKSSINQGDSIAFFDLSSGTPSGWAWSFPGGFPDSSNIQNPVISYPNPGVYDVSLNASDASGNSTETKVGYIVVLDTNAIYCDTLRWPLSGTATLYTTTGGYTCGTNTYGDLAKAEFFPNTDTSQSITAALLRFGAATGNGTFKVAVWDNTGSGGKPGAIPIAYTQLSIASVVNDVQQGLHTYVPFNPPVKPGSNYYIGVILPTLSGDTLAIVSNQDGQANPVNAWEQWSDGSWWHFTDAWVGTADIQQAIFPIMCNVNSDSVIAGFSADTLIVPEHYSIHFTDTSTGPVLSRNWSFPGGNPTVSSSPTPVVQYDSAGIYNVSLIVNGFNNADTLMKSFYISVQSGPTAIIGWDSLHTNKGGTLSFTSLSSGDDLSFLWSLPGGTAGSLTDTTVTVSYADVGVFQSSLIVSSPWGNPDTAFFTITIEDELWGRITYANDNLRPMSAVLVIFESSGFPTDSAYSNPEGYYSFSGLSGNGQVSSVPGIPYPGGATNATDALLILKHFTGFTTLSGIRLEAADVDASGYVNSTDALQAAKRFAGVLTSFNAGDWLSEKAVINHSGNSQRMDIKIIVTGDVNASYTP